jgi:hypothetical protein
MATVTGLTADRMLAIEAESVVDGDVVGDNLILTKHDGSQINAGSVRGPQGIPGPVGSMLSVIAAQPVSDVGIINQIRAGRQLSPADFANIGLSAPLGLWNLSDLSDASGNGRALSNKGAVSFGGGINGAANTAAQFVGSAAQVLYIADSGVADPFRLKTGTFGAWFRTPKKNPPTAEYIISKSTSASGGYGWFISLGPTANGSFTVSLQISGNGTAAGGIFGLSDVCDEKWHFVVATYDGVLTRLYVDGLLEASANLINGAIFQSSGPFNIGGYGGDAATASVSPFAGRIDEVFVTSDVLSEDQVRNLYCAKIPHTLAVVPSRFSINVRRRRRGAALVAADFPTQPLRLHNFSAGSLGDEGSNAIALASASTEVSIAGVDGTANNAQSFIGSNNLYSTDAGLPAGLATRSYGAWFKSTSTGSVNIMAWGQTPGTNDDRLLVNNGQLISFDGTDSNGSTFVADGQWHFATVVEDNTAADGVKRRLYLDGRLVSASMTMIAIVLGGATNFRVGSNSTGGGMFVGAIDSVFVCDYALTPEQIVSLYNKSLTALTPSPKNVGDHIEAVDANNILATFDSIESQNQIDLAVAA